MSTTGKKNNYKYKHMEAKQHASEKPTSHRRKQKWNKNMYRKQWKRKHNNWNPMGFSKNSAKGTVHSNTGIPQETRKKVK